MGLFRKGEPPAPPANTVIAPDTLFKGELVSQRDVDLSGRLEGSADCRGTIRLGRSSVLEGSARCGALHCSGTLKADATVSGLATFTAEGIFEGTLSTKALTIEKGARLEGTLRQKQGPP